MKWFALLSLFLLASLTFVEVDSEDIDEDDSDGDGVPDDEDDDDDNDGIPDDGKLCNERDQFVVLDPVLSFALHNPSCLVLQRQINIFVHHLDDDDDDNDDVDDVDEDDEDGDEEEDSGGVQLMCLQWHFQVREDLLEHLRSSVCPFVRPSHAKNLDQLYTYSLIYASQTHITIHIPKAHDATIH